ncbi:hypothetical protein GCM10022406_16470 [Hymenobacter algoricola]|uniref:Uncharacterized protein n=1 Tax=Hymenobacter algoricola TaxID=486267 RepID=A0ABP7MZN6_9BACT
MVHGLYPIIHTAPPFVHALSAFIHGAPPFVHALSAFIHAGGEGIATAIRAVGPASTAVGTDLMHSLLLTSRIGATVEPVFTSTLLFL